VSIFSSLKHYVLYGCCYCTREEERRSCREGIVNKLLYTVNGVETVEEGEGGGGGGGALPCNS